MGGLWQFFLSVARQRYYALGYSGGPCVVPVEVIELQCGARRPVLSYHAVIIKP